MGAKMNDWLQGYAVTGRTQIFRVRGTIKAVWECDCPDCSGHEVHRSIDRLVLADNSDLAADIVLSNYVNTNPDGAWDASWEIGPTIEAMELPEDIRLRLLRAVELPGLQNS